MAYTALGQNKTNAAPANANPPQARPTAVAVVRMGVLLDGLDQWSKAKTDLNAMKEGILAEAQKREGETKAMASGLKDLPAAAALELQDKIEMTVMNDRAWADQAQDELDTEAAIRMEDVYRRIKAETANLATAQGYDLVMLDDSAGELQIDRESRLDKRTQIEQQILRRQLLYTNPAIDITDDLIQRMNNAFKTQ
jgi:Skp family chaperone for outer membrane proteins